MSASDYKTQFIKASFVSEYTLLLELNRTPVNAFHDPFWQELGSVFEQISNDGNVRVVVLSSTLPKFFSAGLDINATTLKQNESQPVDPARKAFQLRKHIMFIQKCVSSISECSKPVIAAINGICFGGGIDICAACDVRYASSNCTFSIKEVDVGLAADVGTLQRFPKAVANESWVRELAFSARNFDSKEALQYGFVSKVVQGGLNEVTQEAIKTAKLIATKSPVAVTSTKHLLNQAQTRTVEEGLDYTATWNSAFLQTRDVQDSMLSVRKKQTPTYAKL